MPQANPIHRIMTIQELGNMTEWKTYIEENFSIEEITKDDGNILDGSKLMQHVFSINKPLIKLGNLSTQDGKNIQQGYMQIFAGAMTGIRNPKAHSNLIIELLWAIHLLSLASLLIYKLEDAGVN